MIKYQKIDHITVNIRNLEASRKFYTEVLGLKEVKRPNFSFEGAWYSVGDTNQTIHLVRHEGETLRTKSAFTILDGHFALHIESYQDTIDWLDKCGVFYLNFPNPQAGYPQIFVMDPDNNIVELNCNGV